MMKTNLPTGSVLFNLFLCLLPFLAVSTLSAQSFKGKDGAENYTLGTAIVNRYTSLASSASSGSLSVVVSNIAELSGSYSFTNSVNPYATNALSKGDLIMIIQVQGADIETTDDANYGNITNYNNTGNYELRTVYDVVGNTILLCQNLSNSYNQGGRARTQVVRVPRLSSFTVGALATVTGIAWNGTTGGVVAVETDNNMAISGNVNANAIGFRGGTDDKANSVTSGNAALVLYRTTVTTTTAGKGESIAGNTGDYNSFLNGANGRGAPANGGGGGNGHNAGGGGGSNAGNNGVLTPWNGTGLKNVSTAAWANAWNLEVAGFATDVSVGAGRGGYSYSSTNQDALTVGTNNSLWSGNKRCNVGGFGGRPLNYSNNTRLFMGGGGGAGDGNNSASGNGGNGAGIVYLLADGNITGAGTITADGQNGFNTIGVNIDAAGGAGGGGSIVLNVQGTVTGVSLQANGGNGGSQLLLATEAEGPGGGGSGGYIATVATAVSRVVSGGTNGTSASLQVTEFLPNGATIGAAGTIATITYSHVFSCTPEGIVLPVKLFSFTAALRDAKVNLAWATDSEEKSSHFEIQRSTDGHNFTSIATVFAAGNASVRSNYAYTDNLNGNNQQLVYYRLKMIDTDQQYTYSETRIVRMAKQNSANTLTTYPNPVQNSLFVTLPAEWQGKAVKFELYDLSGKMTRSSEQKNANQTETINMKDLVTGFYIVRASTGGQFTQQRVIKN